MKKIETFIAGRLTAPLARKPCARSHFGAGESMVIELQSRFIMRARSTIFVGVCRVEFEKDPKRGVGMGRKKKVT